MARKPNPVTPAVKKAIAGLEKAKSDLKKAKIAASDAATKQKQNIEAKKAAVTTATEALTLAKREAVATPA